MFQSAYLSSWQSAAAADRRVKPKPLSPPLVVTSPVARTVLLESLSIPRKAGESRVIMRSPAAAEKEAPVRETVRQMRCILLEVLDILVQLGAWCAGFAANNHVQLLQQQLERCGGSGGDLDSRRLMQLVITHMQIVVRKFGGRSVIVLWFCVRRSDRWLHLLLL